jgi:hypothetical protein
MRHGFTGLITATNLLFSVMSGCDGDGKWIEHENYLKIHYLNIN